MNIKRIIKDTCILFIITIVSGCLLGFVYNSTKDKIAAKQEETKLLAYKQVMSEADDFKADYSKLIQQSPKLLTKDYGKNGIEITNALGAYKDNKLKGFVITKTGKEKDNEIDSLSSATITSKAVTNGVNGALDFYDLLKGDGQHE